jgi:hypothetical protein
MANTTQEIEEDKKIEIGKKKAIRKFFIITGILAIINILIINFSGTLYKWFIIPISAVIIFFEIYLIMAPQDIFGVFLDEGYFGVLVVGKGKFFDIILNHKGFAFDKNWWVVEETNPTAVHKDRTKYSLGMHLIFSPIVRLYTHRLRWLKYDSIKKIFVERSERLRQTSLMPYPFSIGVTQAEDSKRAPLDIDTVVPMKIVNPYLAIFNVTTEWIDVVSPLIQGAYVAYLKQQTFADLITRQHAIGKDLMKFIIDSGLYCTIRSKYGIEILSIEVINLAGGDKEVDAALKANALAELQKEATITNAKAQAEKITILAEADAKRRSAVATAFMDMLVTRTGLTPEDITAMQANEPQQFQHLYGDIVKQCNESVAQQVSADNGALLHILSPGGKKGGNSGGTNTDLIATVAGIIKAMNMQGSGKSSQQTQSTQKDSKDSSEEKKKTYGELAREALKEGKR